MAAAASVAEDDALPVFDAAPAPARDQRVPEGDAADLTLECAPDAAVCYTPFVAPASPVGVAPPGKRWAYFDTQTGQSLPVPVLEDAPEGPEQ